MNEENQEIEISFVELFQFIKRGIIWALPLALLLAIGVYLFSQTIQPSYQAEAAVLAYKSNNELKQFDTTLVTAPPIDGSAYKEAIYSYPVISSVFEKLGNDEPEQKDINDIKKKVSIRTEEGRSSSTIKISVKDNQPEQASKLANLFADELIAWENQRAAKGPVKIINALEAQIATIKEQIVLSKTQPNPPTDEIRGLEAKLADARLQMSNAKTLLNSAIGNLEKLSPALVPIKPVSPRPKLNATLAFILGLFLAYGVLLLKEALNTKFRSVAELAKKTNQPILGEFPKMHDGKRTLPQEAVNYLRTNVILDTQNSNLLLQDEDVPQFSKVFLVTSANKEEGKSSVARNLAESFARHDYKTLLIDADLRKPVIAGIYNLKSPNIVDLPKILKEPSAPYKPATLKFDYKYNLDVIPTIKAVDNATELLSRGFHKLLADLRQKYDVIIVDSAPVLPVADTLPIASLATGVILVSSMETKDSAGIMATIDKLKTIGVNILGIVATNIPKNSSRGGYGYGYGYGSGYGDDKNSPKGPDKKTESHKTNLKTKRPKTVS